MGSSDTGAVPQKEGKYLYCIAEINAPRTFGPIGIGGRGDEVHAICFQNIAAVVSNSPIIKYRVSRENTISHEKICEEVMKEHTMLPVRFCTIAEDENKVKRILEREYGRFMELLDKMRDKKEVGLKALFKDQAFIYKEIVEKYGDIRALKEKVAALPPEKTYFQRIKIGEMVEAALKAEKEIYKGHILDTLSPLAVETKDNNTYGEQMVVNAAFLIEKHGEPAFCQKVNELNDKYSDRMKFKYVGTTAPFNFVNLEINLEEY